MAMTAARTAANSGCLCTADLRVRRRCLAGLVKLARDRDPLGQDPQLEVRQLMVMAVAQSQPERRD
jgi:hypothetical protein